MPATYEPIATTTLSSTTNNVTFSSIPSTYTDLVVVASLKSNVAANDAGIFVYPNNGVNYCSFTVIAGDGSSVATARITSSNSFSAWYHEVSGASVSDFTTAIYHFNNYSNTTTNKSLLYRTNRASGYTKFYAGLAPTTSAITSLKWTDISGTGFISGSTFTLYGIKAA